MHEDSAPKKADSLVSKDCTVSCAVVSFGLERMAYLMSLTGPVARLLLFQIDI